VRDHTVVIVGGGPSGLFCAFRAAGEGREVILLEKKRSCGRKLLISGSGQCNITHDGEITGFLAHYGDHGTFLRPALMNFTNEDLIAFFQDEGVPMVRESGGKVFPQTRKASDVLDILVAGCMERGVDIRCNEPVRCVARDGSRFTVSSATSTYSADDLVVATGGSSYPVTGSTGDGYALAQGLGHTVTEIAPALAAVYTADYPFSDLAGISFESPSISLFRDGKKLRQQSGDLLLTHSGLSGPGILDLSRYITAGDILKVGFVKGVDRETVGKMLTAAIAAKGARQVKTALLDFPLPERFIKRLLELIGVPSDLTCAHLSKKARGALIALLTEFPFIVKRVGGFDEAMVTRGGVSLDEINPRTMESRLVPHFYCIGEVLDIDGDTGGYNLQAAFSTAALAAQRIARR
jgi:predicted Rossmann fold flavoprotein